MDPLTHTLVGASLAATRLGTTTRYATATLVLGANLPDIDVLSYVAGQDTALAFRRGWTHGMLALVVLPGLLAGMLALWGWGRGRRRVLPAHGPPFAPGRLFALSYLAGLSHPALDWLNTYGMRWWMPFDGTWYYGDSVFIIDPWLWLILGFGWLLGRRPTPVLAGVWALVTTPMVLLAVRRAPEYLPHLAIAFALLLVALLWNRPDSERYRRTAATTGLVLATLFIGAMLLLHALTESAVRRHLTEREQGPIAELMVGPIPANPFAWEFVVERDGRLRHGTLSWLAGGRASYSAFDRPVARTDPRWAQIRAQPGIRGFLDWARFPWIATPESATAVDSRRILVLDARYRRVATAGFGGVAVEIDP